MTVTGETRGVTVGKQVSIANTGDLIFTDTKKVDFNADYTATAGRLFIESAANTINGNITADSLKFGTANTDLAKETNQVVITATRLPARTPSPTAALLTSRLSRLKMPPLPSTVP